jgi:transposase-like protein
MAYTENFKAKIVRRLVGPHAVSAIQLAKEVGISHGTLSKWLRERGTRYPMVSRDDEDGSVVELRRSRRPQDWPAAERLEAVLEASALDDAELGAFLRSKGLHEADLAEWRRAALEALGGDQPGRKAKPVDAKRFKELEREVKSLGADLRRKEKALAEVTALLVLKKKLDALHLDEDDDDPGRSGK